MFKSVFERTSLPISKLSFAEIGVGNNREEGRKTWKMKSDFKEKRFYSI